MGLLAWVSIAWADMSAARKLPSDTFKRFMVNGTDFKDALSACNFARQGTGWKAVSFDPPNTGGGVNCKYKKGGDSGEQVGATLVLRCPENATTWASGSSDVNQQVCACIEGFIASGLACAAPERPADKICTDAVYDDLKNGYDVACKQSGGMSCGRSKLTEKQYAKMGCDDAKVNLGKQTACLASRTTFQQKCYASVDPRHQVVLDDHAKGVKACEAAVLDKCGASSPK